MSSTSQTCLGVLTCLLALGTCRADVFVIASAEAPLQTVDIKEVQSLYMGRRRVLAGGGQVQATDLPRSHPLRELFYVQLTGMTAAQVNSYWARLLFSGQSTPPMTFADETHMASYLKRTPSALGYASSPPAPASGLKTVMVLKSATDTKQGNAP
ncbi:MAG: hypothetical protein KBF66_09405 [Rhodoferax sp.]|uniref:hypothetical protein n=1 Tax=Rhodoferax sp. TaxID=50421 RepID=UPI001B70BF8C|nr:hypothetical protein [Rhodoferax sp.]MBP9905762.1 hypothetical protein [Rhodoferax sp.]